MKKTLIQVLDSPLARIARLGALLCVILSILNTSIVLPQTVIFSEAQAQYFCRTDTGMCSGTCDGASCASCTTLGQQCPSSPEMPAMLAPVFALLLSGMALRLRRRFIAELAL